MVSKPKAENTKTAFLETSIEYSPSKFVTDALFVPFSFTEAEGTGSPETLSETVPEIIV